MIPFNKPAVVGNEFLYMQDAVRRGKLSGNGHYTAQCQNFFRAKYGFKKTLLTNSCTAALEMAAILCDIQQNDEVIVPSFTFPSCANAFALRGAKIIFADSEENSPNVSAASIEKNISLKTKAIVIVHYAGSACDVETITALAKKHNLFLIEDCAHSIESFYAGKALGRFGDFAAFSFHETKNIQCGEGGLLVINNEKYFERADIIWEKGTNRVAFARGEIKKYNWVDIGSSFLMSELQAAYLFAQLEKLQDVQQKRRVLCDIYLKELTASESGNNQFILQHYKASNASIMYLLCRDKEKRDELIVFLEQKNIMALFHYLPLHLSPFHLQTNALQNLPRSENFSNTILRLPLFYDLQPEDARYISACIVSFYQRK